MYEVPLKRKYRFEKKVSKLWELITIVINFNELDTVKENISVPEERLDSNSECVTKT